MKINRSIPVLIMIMTAFAFLSPHAAHSGGKVEYTKEMVLGKWYNINLPISKNGHMEIFIFNKNGTFEYNYLTLESETEKKTSTKSTGKFKVENNMILCLDVQDEDLRTDLFPPLWHIVADEQNAKLDQLELKPDPCRCGDHLSSKLFVRDRGV